MISVIMSGVLGIYCVIVAIIISGGVSAPNADGISTYSAFSAYGSLAAGLCCGFTCLAAGWATGVAGEVGATAYGIR